MTSRSCGNILLNMSRTIKHLVVCHECDQILQEISLPPGGSACCLCCGATLYRHTDNSINRTLALSLAAAILFVIANFYPILGIEVQGKHNNVNLIGAVHTLWKQDMHIISSLVCVTTILVPVIELSMMIYILLPLSMRKVPDGISLIMRIIQNIKPWDMIEVFMLGILVSLVKMTHSSTIIIGVALWCFAGLTILLAAVAASFNPRDVWTHLDSDVDGKTDP